MALANRPQTTFTKHIALITGPNNPHIAEKLLAWQRTLPCEFTNMRIMELDKCTPPIGFEPEIADAPGTVPFFGDSRLPSYVYEVLADSLTAGTDTCSIFVRVCQSGEAAHVLGRYEEELLETLTVVNEEDGYGERSIFEVRQYDLRGLPDEEFDVTLQEAYRFAHTAPIGVTLHQARSSSPSAEVLANPSSDVHYRLCENNLQKIDNLMMHVEVSIITRDERSSRVQVRLPACHDHLRLPVEARTGSLEVWANEVSRISTDEEIQRRWGRGRTLPQTPIAALNLEPPRCSSFHRTPLSEVGVHPSNRRPASPPGTSMVGAPFSDEAVLHIQNMDPSVVWVGSPTTIAPPSMAPPETPTVVNVPVPEIDDAVAHLPPTTRLECIDERTVGLPEPSIIVTPPAWVCCAHGEHHDHLTKMYSWLIEPKRSCDDSSLFSFFALLQYNPESYEACLGIIREIAEIENKEKIGNYSAKLSSMVEATRQNVHPDGSEHKGSKARIVPVSDF